VWEWGQVLASAAAGKNQYSAAAAAAVWIGFTFLVPVSLQCFDAVGWVAGRASGL